MFHMKHQLNLHWRLPQNVIVPKMTTVRRRIFQVWGIFMNYVPRHAAVESALTVWRSVPALPPFLKHALILFDAALVESLLLDQYETYENPNRLLLLRICLNFFSNYFLSAAAQTTFFTPSYSMVFHVLKTWKKNISLLILITVWTSMDITKPQNPFWYKLLWRDFDVSEVLQNNLLRQPG